MRHGKVQMRTEHRLRMTELVAELKRQPRMELWFTEMVRGEILNTENLRE